MTAHLHETGTGTGTGEDGVNTLQAWRTGIDTHQEPVVYMRRDCPVCRSEGFTTQARVQLTAGRRSIVATLSVVDGDWLAENVAGLSESAWASLGAQPGQLVTVTHAPPLDSLSHVRAKVYGNALGGAEFSAIISDVAAGHYSDLHLATFITACAGDRLDLAETVSLTKAMIGVGDRIDWGRPLVVDKHCVGGLPGNRTTLLVVPIVAACGLTMPKTSSRAITSPAGTADTMEVLAPVNLDVRSMRRVVERTGGCIVWGGSVRLSPADDILIRVERPLDLDSEGQLVASVLSKKAAAGSTHVLIDLPVGATAKVRSAQAAAALGRRLQEVGSAIGLHVALRVTDGEQPVGRGIGPALEARDVLAVLQGTPEAPADLRERALRLAADILEMGGAAPAGGGLTARRRTPHAGPAQAAHRPASPSRPVRAGGWFRLADLHRRHGTLRPRMGGWPVAGTACPAAVHPLRDAGPGPVQGQEQGPGGGAGQLPPRPAPGPGRPPRPGRTDRRMPGSCRSSGRTRRFRCGR